MLRSGNSVSFVSWNCTAAGRSNIFLIYDTGTNTMTSKQSGTIRFPTAQHKGPFPFPTARSTAPKPDGATEQADQQLSPEEQLSAELNAEEQLSPEELRLMADTMPGDGPGD
jgi:hypothetical protein